MNMMKNSMIAATSLLIVASFSCGKKNEAQKRTKPTDVAGPAKTETGGTQEQPAAPGAVVEAKPISNTTGLQVVKVSETKYLVLPAKKEINTISLANNPIKENCKEISSLTHELTKLELEKATIASAVSDDDMSLVVAQEQIDIKTQELFYKKDARFTHTIKYSKAALLKGLETLRKANAGIVFELKQDSKTVIAVVSPNEKVATQSSFSTSDLITEGAFDETESDVKMKLGLSYGSLCMLKELNSKALSNGSKSKLEMSFQ